MTTRQAELLTVEFAKMLVKIERLLRQLSGEDAAHLLSILGQKLGGNSGEFGSKLDQLRHSSSSSSVSNNNNASNEEQKRKNQELRQQAIRILNFLNEKTGRSFRLIDANLRLIERCLRTGATEQDCKGVVARKHRAWGNDPKMSVYLRPITLFSASKFEQYLGEKEPIS